MLKVIQNIVVVLDLELSQEICTTDLYLFCLSLVCFSIVKDNHNTVPWDYSVI